MGLIAVLVTSDCCYKWKKRGAWLAHSEACVTLDLGFVNWSPTWGIEITLVINK